MNILVLGVNGLIGSTVFRYLSEYSEHLVFGTVRNQDYINYFNVEFRNNVIHSVDVNDFDKLVKVFNDTSPGLVINCAGITKHLRDSESHLVTIPINSVAPHRLAQICHLTKSRLLHISTDCVFSGKKGNYWEEDFPDANDLYGRSKVLGEVSYGNNLTIRTSTVGHELMTNFGLLNWFLSQEGSCKGFKNVIFSGLPTVYLAKIINEYIIPSKDLNGLYHVSAEPISKYNLLNLIAERYSKKIKIIPEEDFKIDRSLISDRFRSLTGFKPPSWQELVNIMFEDINKSELKNV